MTSEKIMDAPDGIFILYEIINPSKAPTRPITIEITIMFLNFFVNKLAMDCGIVNKDITKMIPTIFMFNTMVKATRLIST